MHIGISLIHEPWINRDAISGLGGGGLGFVVISTPRHPTLGRASWRRTSTLSHYWIFVPDLMVASVDLTGIGKLAIGSAYFPHDSASHPPEEVRLLVDW